MIISNRIKEIIEIIIESRDYVSIEKISIKMNISKRTIYRELSEIKSILAKHGIELLTASNKGIIAVGPKENIFTLKQFLYDQNEVLIIESNQRADFILLGLIQESDYVKTEAIAIDNNYPLSTVRNDLKKIQEKIARYELHIIQQKRQGIIIKGSLIEKNHLLTDIILDRVEENIIYRWLNKSEEENNPFLQRLEEFGFKNIIQQTHDSLRIVLYEEDSLTNIKTRDYLEVVFLLALMLYYHGTVKRYAKYMESQKENPEKRDLVNKVVSKIGKDFSIILTSEELTYIQWVLQINMVKNDSHVTTIRNHTLNEEIMKFIESVEERMGISLSRDQELKEGLYTHMEKALARIRSNMQITNPALDEIRQTYGELFFIIKQEINKIFLNDYFPDDEIGYLLLYFAITLDKYAKKAFRVLVICSGGMGSSKMLANSLEREIPEIQIVKTTSVVTLGKETLGEYDLILSTIPLYLPEDSYLRVSPMLHKNEILKIKEKIRRHKHSMLRRIDNEERNDTLFQGEYSENILNEVSVINKLALSVISNFHVFEYNKSQGLKNDKVASLSDYRYKKLINHSLDINDTTEYISFLIPTTSIAYYERIYTELTKPLIFVHRYIHPNQLKSKNDIFYNAVFVLYPEKMQETERKTLKFMVEFILEDVDFLKGIKSYEEKYLKNLLSYRVRQYLIEKLKG
ncbi:mannitol operon transcriptional antiterminator [Enterococcus sp. DIV2402]|uniref:Mannitol operon transcriptional antiterminator n=1 Tax=Candidatus Enterococcus lowellii TaxID=2230877 RepID=A0ABZ2SU44_9ENTE|nr:transcription antiterminator [Enterococcus sp. DIV2402]